MERVVRGELTRAAAALVRGVSERQSVRLTARIRTEGGRGGIHGHREQYAIFFPGQISPECLPSPVEENALAPVHPIRRPAGNME